MLVFDYYAGITRYLFISFWNPLLGNNTRQGSSKREKALTFKEKRQAF
jgi:hypothetical protein